MIDHLLCQCFGISYNKPVGACLLQFVQHIGSLQDAVAVRKAEIVRFLAGCREQQRCTAGEVFQVAEKVRGFFLVGQDKYRSEEHTSELQSLMRISYAVFCLKTKKNKNINEEQQHKKKH